jgi:hypothetical protein
MIEQWRVRRHSGLDQVFENATLAFGALMDEASATRPTILRDPAGNEFLMVRVSPQVEVQAVYQLTQRNTGGA